MFLVHKKCLYMMHLTYRCILITTGGIVLWYKRLNVRMIHLYPSNALLIILLFTKCYIFRIQKSYIKVYNWAEFIFRSIFQSPCSNLLYTPIMTSFHSVTYSMLIFIISFHVIGYHRTITNVTFRPPVYMSKCDK